MLQYQTMISGALLFNPASGRGDKMPRAVRLVELLKEQGASVELRPTRRPGDVAVLARESLADGAEFLAVLGGDGSIREAGEELLGSAVPLLILPAGTSNVLARSLNIPLDPLKAARLFSEGCPKAMDGGTADGNPFFFMCGAGIDAEIMGALNLPSKKLFGRASFYPAVFKLLAFYRFPHLNVDADGEHLSGGYALVSNIPHYAGKYVLIPDADPFDGFLDCVVFEARSWMSYIGHYRRLRAGTLMNAPGVIHRRVKRVRIEGPPSTRVQLDGDAMGAVPVEIEVRPAALRIFLPKEG